MRLGRHSARCQTAISALADEHHPATLLNLREAFSATERHAIQRKNPSLSSYGR